jgi:hypothetical protein
MATPAVGAGGKQITRSGMTAKAAELDRKIHAGCGAKAVRFI